LPAEPDCAPAGVVYLYDENSVLATVNPVYPLVVQDVALPAKHLKKLFKSVAGVAFSRLGQHLDQRFITSCIR
jgi:hypothetical protein